MVLFSNLRFFGRDLQDARKKLSDMENKRKNSGEEAEKLRNALQEAVDKAKNANKEVSITILPVFRIQVLFSGSAIEHFFLSPDPDKIQIRFH